MKKITILIVTLLVSGYAYGSDLYKHPQTQTDLLAKTFKDAETQTDIKGKDLGSAIQLAAVIANRDKQKSQCGDKQY